MKDKITIFLVTEQDQVIFQGIVVTGLFHNTDFGGLLDYFMIQEWVLLEYFMIQEWGILNNQSPSLSFRVFYFPDSLMKNSFSTLLLKIKLFPYRKSFDC